MYLDSVSRSSSWWHVLLWVLLYSQRRKTNGLATNQNPILSSVFSAIGSSAVENDTITCIKECPASMLYRTLCPCLNKKLNRLMKTLGSIQYDVAADRRSLREYIDHSLLLEEEALTAENIADIEHASLFAEKLKLHQFNVETLLTIHRIALAQDSKIAGKIRSHPMFVPKGPGDIFLRMPEPEELDISLENYFRWFHSELEQKSTHPIVFAAMAKLLFIRIHPFSDGNGRVSRILLNVILRKTLLPFWTFIPSNEITKYYNVIGDVEERLNLVPYLSYVITCIERSLTLYLEDQKNQRIEL
ncbi:protein adenylyltransferase Fic-like isoform X2 [Planococcus citri]|uniref:protein adenylyltransferase Fic-like isoform X2 n=1 Tax=Planococcus citri TaxID=170843 RepID=UPI0031FA2F20